MFNRLREDTNRLREDTNRRFEELIKEMHDGFVKTNKAYRKLTRQIRRMGGDNLELLSLGWFKGLLEARGFPVDNLRWRKIFDDPEEISGSKKAEFDIFSEEPLVAVEVTSYVEELKKINKFIKKIKFLKEKFKKEPLSILITYGFEKNIEEDALTLLKANNIKLHTVGSKLYLRLEEAE